MQLSHPSYSSTNYWFCSLLLTTTCTEDFQLFYGKLVSCAGTLTFSTLASESSLHSPLFSAVQCMSKDDVRIQVYHLLDSPEHFWSFKPDLPVAK